MGNLDFSANADQLKELAAYMASQINVPTIGIGGGYAPIGSINFFDATVAPQDWLACDGTVYNIADYPQLADWYEAQHGSKNFYGGDGTTTFAVPNLQGEFLRGTGTNSHANQGSGAALGVHQDGTEHMNDGTTTDDFEAFHMPGAPIKTDSLIGNVAGRYLSMSSIRTGSRAAYFTSRPTNTSFLICVKAVVAGEVYSTEERVVGTWIDGKKIYQKSIQMTTPSANTTWAVLMDVSSWNIDTFIDYHGYINNQGLDSSIMPFVDANGLTSGFSIAYEKTSGKLYYAIHNWLNQPCVVTFKYTKTTD